LILSGAFYPDLKIGVWRRERINDRLNLTFVAEKPSPSQAFVRGRFNGGRRAGNIFDYS